MDLNAGSSVAPAMPMRGKRGRIAFTGFPNGAIAPQTDRTTASDRTSATNSRMLTRLAVRARVKSPQPATNRLVIFPVRSSKEVCHEQTVRDAQRRQG
jgi:hypothetical protein